MFYIYIYIQIVKKYVRDTLIYIYTGWAKSAITVTSLYVNIMYVNKCLINEKLCSHCSVNDFSVTGIIHCNCSNVNRHHIENRIIF